MKRISKRGRGPLAACLIPSLTACAGPKIFSLKGAFAWPALLAGALLLFGCAAAPCPPAERIAPPVVYLQGIPEPTLAGKTNAHLADWALELRAALRTANEDKRAIRVWAGRGQ